MRNRGTLKHWSVAGCRWMKGGGHVTRNHAGQDVFDYIERFCNPTHRHSTLGYLSPMDFEKQAHVA